MLCYLLTKKERKKKKEEGIQQNMCGSLFFFVRFSTYDICFK